VIVGSDDARRRAFVALIVGALSIPGVASAQTKTEREMARALMDEGDAKVDAKDYKGALRAYRAAHTIMNVPTTGIEVARVEAQLGHLVEARKVALEIVKFPSKPGEPKPFVEARTEATALVTQLDTKIPTLTVEVVGVPENAPVEVKIDGVLVPSEEARSAHPVDPGKHEVSAAASGLPPVSKEVEAAEGKQIKVKLALGDAAASEQVDPDKPSRKISPLVIVGFGAGGVGLIAGAVTGILSISRAGTVDGLCPGGVCPTQEKLNQAKPENETALTLANVSNVAFALGIVGVGVGVAGIFLSSSEPRKPESTSLRVHVGPTSLGLSGTF